MKPRFARALIVLAVFAALALLTATDWYVTATAAPPVPPPSAKATPGSSSFPQALKPGGSPQRPLRARVFLNQFRNYLAWALVMPGILYLARRVPLLGRHRARALLFHRDGLEPGAADLARRRIRATLDVDRRVV